LLDFAHNRNKYKIGCHNSARLRGLVAFYMWLLSAITAFIDTGRGNVNASKFGSFNKLAFGGINVDILINGSLLVLCYYDPV
jgi:hypothetical protein